MKNWSKDFDFMKYIFFAKEVSKCHKTEKII